MADILPTALAAAERAIIKAGRLPFGQDDIVAGPSSVFARVALEAAVPILADQIASAILRHADEHEPAPGTAGYLAWHRHFETASTVAAKSFGRDNLEAPRG